MEILRHKPDILAEGASAALGSLLSKYPKQQILLMLSGGSALKILEDLDMRNIDSRTTIAVLDERYSEDPIVNNCAGLMRSTFGQVAAIHKSRFIDTRVKSGESIDALTRRFNDSLREWRENNEDGKIIITQGMGVDGHTAGIMPYPEDRNKFVDLFEKPDKWVVGYDAGQKNQYSERVTVTPSFLREEVDHSVVFISGEEKRNALDRIIFERGSAHDTPAMVMREMKDVQLFTDIQ